MFFTHLRKLPFASSWTLSKYINFYRPCPSFRYNYGSDQLQHCRTLQTSASRKSLDSLERLIVDCGCIGPGGLVPPLICAIGMSTLSIVGCAWWENKSVAVIKSGPKVTEDTMREAGTVFFPILLANLLVFCAWHVRPWQPFMAKWFLSSPNHSVICLPMLLSTFSHFSALHLLGNMYVLQSFLPPAVGSLGKEQFLAMYLCGGIAASFASLVVKVILQMPGLSLGAVLENSKFMKSYQGTYMLHTQQANVSYNAVTKWTYGLYRSYIVSGAILSVVAYVCVSRPETKVSLVFLPIYTLTAGTALKAMMCLDFLGLVLGWKLFDHAAHLGGALFGIFWYHWGSKHIWDSSFVKKIRRK